MIGLCPFYRLYGRTFPTDAGSAGGLAVRPKFERGLSSPTRRVSRRGAAGAIVSARVRESVMWVADAFGSWIRTGLHDSWAWLTSLNYQEWFLLLGITSAAGFLCMRGFGSRSDY